VGAWASVLELKCYIPSAPTDTHTPHVHRVQVRAHCCACEIVCTFVIEPCVRVKCFFMDRFHSVQDGARAHPISVLGVNVTVERMDLTEGEETAAICERGSKTPGVPILDLPLPFPLSGESSGSRLIVAGGWDGGDRLSVFYEFRALEGFLTRRQMRKLCATSMRAKLSRTSSFVNTYEWAEIKRDPNRCYCAAGCSLTSTTPVLVTLQSPMSEAV
jgi:hypothetical protein